MTGEGVFSAKKISQREFIEAILKHSPIVRLGYKQNIEMINSWTGLSLQPNRDKFVLEIGDTAWVMKYKKRVKNPSEKGNIVNKTLFTYWKVQKVK